MNLEELRNARLRRFQGSAAHNDESQANTKKQKHESPYPNERPQMRSIKTEPGIKTEPISTAGMYPNIKVENEANVASTKKEEEEEEEGWSCTTCTMFHTNQDFLACSACGTPRFDSGAQTVEQQTRSDSFEEKSSSMPFPVDTAEKRNSNYSSIQESPQIPIGNYMSLLNKEKAYQASSTNVKKEKENEDYETELLSSDGRRITREDQQSLSNEEIIGMKCKLIDTHPDSYESGGWIWIHSPNYHDNSFADARPDRQHKIKAFRDEFQKHTSQNDQVTNEWIMKLAVKYDVKYGKWLIHVKPQFAGWKWWAIRNAVLDGKLGPTAKISTRASENYNNLHVICIYCPDFTDKKELLRIRQTLHDLEITKDFESLSYKADAMTYLQIYSSNRFGLQTTWFSCGGKRNGRHDPHCSTLHCNFIKCSGSQTCKCCFPSCLKLLDEEGKKRRITQVEVQESVTDHTHNIQSKVATMSANNDNSMDDDEMKKCMEDYNALVEEDENEDDTKFASDLKRCMEASNTSYVFAKNTKDQKEFEDSLDQYNM
ncbi:hypothetical protein CTEN210_10826 [Chaetoceros tenuissimus]|uniref:RanBP2-type domain-containing protein n=1 Tax=Chaetoceros tenuissimus TaxID=426638 RepID=A0AAD3H8I8_9STRA|nr:hypothetical protein CTEN210_10826 [Chaetoceros tenuissimus]